MWILILIVLAVVVYFLLSQSSSSNQVSKASSQNYINQIDYSNLEVSLETSASNYYGLDYRCLRDLLAEGKWREADEETSKMMLRVAKYDKKENYITPQIPQHIPCEDICTIDRLWLKYSNGRFGFSVQRRILLGIREDALMILLRHPSERKGNYYEEMKLEMKLEENFNELIGWYDPISDGGSGTANYEELTFSIQAPYGHLPTANMPVKYGLSKEPFLNTLIILNVLKRLSTCGIAL
jgi:hypothetical protein